MIATAISLDNAVTLEALLCLLVLTPGLELVVVYLSGLIAGLASMILLFTL